MKMTVQRRLKTLGLRARQKNLDELPPGYWTQRLLERLAQIRSRIPPEQLLAYRSKANAEQRQRDMEEIRAHLRGVCSQHDATGTKFLRLRTPVTLGSRFGDWQVSWLGGWSKHRLFFPVMVVKVQHQNDEPQSAAGTA
jgi:hypothetical protein